MNTTTETPTTIKGWLLTLPEPARSQALLLAETNYANCELGIDKIEASTIATALYSAFNWKHTPNGTQYWMEVLKAATA